MKVAVVGLRQLIGRQIKFCSMSEFGCQMHTILQKISSKNHVFYVLLLTRVIQNDGIRSEFRKKKRRIRSRGR